VAAANGVRGAFYIGAIECLGHRLLGCLEDQHRLLEGALLLGDRVLDDLGDRVQLADQHRRHPATRWRILSNARSISRA